MKRVSLGLLLLMNVCGLFGRQNDSLFSNKLRHFDLGYRGMIAVTNQTVLTPVSPGLNLSYGVLKQRGGKRFTDWEIHVGGMKMKSPLFLTYYFPDPRYSVIHPPPSVIGSDSYIYNFSNVACQYKTGRLQNEQARGFFWSAGGAIQLNFLRSYKPLSDNLPGHTVTGENRFGNISYLEWSYPALAAVFEAGIVSYNKNSKLGIRISFFGEAQLTPSRWVIPYAREKTTLTAFPMMAGIRVGFLTPKNKPAEKKVVVEKIPNSNPVIIYGEAFGPGGWGSGNVEFKMTESRDSLFTLNLRTGIGVLEVPGVIVGFHETIGKHKCRFDIGEGIAFTDGDLYLFLSVGFRYTSDNGFFIRPAFTPLFGFYDRLPFGGLSVGYAFPVKQKGSK